MAWISPPDVAAKQKAWFMEKKITSGEDTGGLVPQPRWRCLLAPHTTHLFMETKWQQLSGRPETKKGAGGPLLYDSGDTGSGQKQASDSTESAVRRGEPPPLPELRTKLRVPAELPARLLPVSPAPGGAVKVQRCLKRIPRSSTRWINVLPPVYCQPNPIWQKKVLIPVVSHPTCLPTPKRLLCTVTARGPPP